MKIHLKRLSRKPLFLVFALFFFLLSTNSKAFYQYNCSFDSDTCGFGKYNYQAGYSSCVVSGGSLQSSDNNPAICRKNLTSSSVEFPINITYWQKTANTWLGNTGLNNATSTTSAYTNNLVFYGIGIVMSTAPNQRLYYVNGTNTFPDYASNFYQWPQDLGWQKVNTYYYGNGTIDVWINNTFQTRFNYTYGSNITGMIIYSRGSSYAQFDNLTIKIGTEGCTSSLSNVSYTDWFNKTSCSISDIIGQNRSYTIYDTAGCISNQSIQENRNISCSYCNSGYENLSICENLNTELNSINQENNMIAIVLLYGIFLFMSYWQLRSHNVFSGWMMYALTIIFDFFLAGQLYKTYSADLVLGITGQLTWIFFVGFILWIAVKIGSLVLLQTRVFKNV